MQQDAFKVEGGHSLQGEITPQGAKNEALQVIAGTLLTAEPVTIHNIPDIKDVNALIQLLRDMKVEVEKLHEVVKSLILKALLYSTNQHHSMTLAKWPFAITSS